MPCNGGKSPGVVPGDNIATAQLVGMIQRQAAATAYANDFYLLALVTILVLPLVWLLRPPRTAVSTPLEIREVG
jgi:hypothetical protein